MRRRLLALTAAACLTPAPADAFCGFYVGRAGDPLVNRATTVVLMRDGTHTVLSMRNDYTGPLADFAMVVPVPVVLRRGDVRTLPHDVFDQVDRLAAPRLVEYWERDPCMYAGSDSRYTVDGANTTSPSFGTISSMYVVDGDHGVRVEAKFRAGEYDVEILGARDSLGLTAWLRAHGYNLPANVEPALRPYVQAGMKFFVAKVAIDRVRREPDGRVTLSPLRFHYDSDQFSLPVRLGLLNSSGHQDLVVHVLAHERYQAANRPNVAIPTNLDVIDAARDAFPQFYAALLDRTLADVPGAAVTEYAWQSGKCDPCPGPVLDQQALATLGGDVLWGASRPRTIPLEPDTRPTGKVDMPDDDPFQPTVDRADRQAASRRRPADNAPSRWPSDLVLTRLHLRYEPGSLGDDLVLQAAPPIVGGLETIARSQAARPGGQNNFQARYAIRHAWPGPIACANPERGVWRGPPDGRPPQPRVATNSAFVARDAALTTFLAGDPPAPAAADALPPALPEPPPPSSARCDTTPESDAWLILLAIALTRRRRNLSRRASPR